MSGYKVRLPDGLTLHADVVGRGPPLLLIHGFTGSAAAWGGHLLAELAEVRRVIAVDLPGHGRSDAPADPERYALPALVDDLCQLLVALDAPAADWVGYSMGGRVALGAAVLAPERVTRLVLEGASPGLATEEERRARREQDEALAIRLEQNGIEAFVDEWAALPIFASQRRLSQSIREAERARRLRNETRALAACLRGLGTGAQPSFWERLADVRAPTLLVTGEEDRKFTEIAAEMAKRLPDARVATVSVSGHCVHLEAPEPWLEVVRSCLV
jgi:2-succinyl-6-hydroxy-2,4-cyclohexadiene-1-carboxylate synthase